jgi:Putative prokaryotic signal transducing protein
MALDDRRVVVFADAQPGLAYLVHNRLAESGIESFIENESLPYGANELLPAVIGPRVVVSDVDAAAAREIVAEFQREPKEMAAVDDRLSAAPARGPEALALDVLERGAPTDATCPHCGHARMTVCPYCQTASTDFPQADQPAVDGDGESLLICGTCDEPFVPQYYRRCEWCGHDFGSGIEIKSKDVSDYLNDRVIVAVVGSALILLVIFAYFSTILR